MACPTCGNSILFGGIKDGKNKYCSKRCYEADEVGRHARELPSVNVEMFANEIHSGLCPKCNGTGPIDIHKSYSIYSIILYTSWKTNEHLICKKCASKQQATDLVGSFLLGWWGFPFGLIVTPIQILMNVVAMFQTPGRYGPTKELLERSRLIMAVEQINSNA